MLSQLRVTLSGSGGMSRASAVASISPGANALLTAASYWPKAAGRGRTGLVSWLKFNGARWNANASTNSFWTIGGGCRGHTCFGSLAAWSPSPVVVCVMVIVTISVSIAPASVVEPVDDGTDDVGVRGVETLYRPFESAVARVSDRRYENRAPCQLGEHKASASPMTGGPSIITKSNLSAARLMKSNILALANSSMGFGGKGPLVTTNKPTTWVGWATSPGLVLPAKWLVSPRVLGSSCT